MTVKPVQKNTEQTHPSKGLHTPHNLEALTQRVNNVTNTYFTLCAQQKNLKPENEELFLQAVLQLSARETSLTRDLSQLEDTATNNLQLDTITKVQTQITRLRTPAQTTQPPAQQRLPKVDNLLAAKNAVAQFEHSLNNPALEPQEKHHLAQKMVDAVELVKNQPGAEAKALKAKKYALLKTAFAPEIPSEIMNRFKAKLAIITQNIAKIASQSTTLLDYIEKQKQEELLVRRIANLKASVVQELAGHSILLDKNNLQLPLFGQYIDTDLTTELENVTIPFSRMQALKADFNLFGLIENDYQAVDMGGSGDCLFRAIAGAQGNDPNLNHLKDRQEAVAHMKANQTRFEPLVTKLHGPNSFEEYLRQMNRRGTWGDEPVIQAMSDLRGQPIVFVQKANGESKVSITHPLVARENVQPIVILNEGHLNSRNSLKGTGVHFQAYLPL